MAKDMQMLPKNTPNPVPLATMGWPMITYHIDITKLRFAHKILASAYDCICRIVFVQRFYEIYEILLM